LHFSSFSFFTASFATHFPPDHHTPNISFPL
jgi:hypothetical protein